ncbi:glycosyltransferase family 2 protein [Coraliomargarita sp. W4R53]
MKISVVICSYNQGRYLEDAILSVINQGYEDKEIILIDGGSNDESLEIIKKYEPYLKHWVSEPDRGQTHAINKGILAAEGEIVGWLNSDDIYLPNSLSTVAKAFKSAAKPNVVHGNRILLDKNSCIAGWSCPGSFMPETYYYNICSETAFWRREFNIAGEMLNEDLRFTMDLEWFSRLYVKYGNFQYIDRLMGAFRCHDESKSATLQHVCLEEGPREWKRIFGREIPQRPRFCPEFYWALRFVTLTTWPTLLRKLLNYRISIKPKAIK